MIAAVLRDTADGEHRVALIPASVPVLAKLGLDIVVETGAGVAAGFPDAAYVEKGARIAASRAEALASADVALQSNILGQEVGIRTNLDVLNVRQNVYLARRDVAQAYFAYLLATLRLKAATGALNETDLEELNRRLAG